jgi:signal transduction histidine kinase
MGVVRGHAEIIADQTDGKVAESATRIGETANDLTALTEKARELESAMRNIAPVEPRDLGTDIETVIEDLRTDYPDAEFRVDGLVNGRVLATERLRLALRELGENAAKHGGSSPVTYRVEPTEEGTVAVRVSDDGPGLSEAEQWVVETGRETALEHGRGLGLWLVNWIVTGVGGDVTTTVDDGTTVTVRLQLAADVDTEGLDYHRHAALSTIPE